MAGKNDDDAMEPFRAHELSANFQSKTKYLNCFICCAKCLKCFGHVMIGIVVLLVLLSWYCVVVLDYWVRLWEKGGSACQVLSSLLVVVLYSAEICMILWSYMATVFTDPGFVPPSWHPFAEDATAGQVLELIESEDHNPDKRDPTRPRYCRRCKAWKPERSHHCSTSQRCIMKMDHWCVWVRNAVGLLNYKHFLLFMIYTFVGSLVGLLLLLPPIFNNLHHALTGNGFLGAVTLLMAVVFDSMFTITLGCFLVMHGNLLAANCTTIEMYEKNRMHPWPYNKGLRRNFEEVFGRNKLRWFIPAYSREEQRALMDTWLSKKGSMEMNLAHTSGMV